MVGGIRPPLASSSDCEGSKLRNGLSSQSRLALFQASNKKKQRALNAVLKESDALSTARSSKSKKMGRTFAQQNKDLVKAVQDARRTGETAALGKKKLYSERKRMNAKSESKMLNTVDVRNWKKKKATVASEAIGAHSAIERLADPKNFTGQYKWRFSGDPDHAVLDWCHDASHKKSSTTMLLNRGRKGGNAAEPANFRNEVEWRLGLRSLPVLGDGDGRTYEPDGYQTPKARLGHSTSLPNLH